MEKSAINCTFISKFLNLIVIKLKLITSSKNPFSLKFYEKLMLSNINLLQCQKPLAKSQLQ